MSVATHPLTYIDPVCGKPAFHRTCIPGADDPIVPGPVEHINGERVVSDDLYSCDSCGRQLWSDNGPDNPIFDPANWTTRLRTSGAAMGTMRHDAIVVTGLLPGLVGKAASIAQGMGLTVIGPSRAAINHCSTFLVCPDGSNEGWAESDAGDQNRAGFITWLDSQAYEDGSSPLAWVAVRYSPDDKRADVTGSAWTSGDE